MVMRPMGEPSAVRDQLYVEGPVAVSCHDLSFETAGQFTRHHFINAFADIRDWCQSILSHTKLPAMPTLHSKTLPPAGK